RQTQHRRRRSRTHGFQTRPKSRQPSLNRLSRQTREIGIRFALGAQPGEILRRMFATSMQLIAPGVAAGLFISYPLASEVPGISPSDALTYGLASAAALLAGLVGSYIPARRATRVNPVTALRCE